MELKKSLDAVKNEVVELLKNMSYGFVVLQATRESGRSFMNFEQINGNVVLDDYKVVFSAEFENDYAEYLKDNVIKVLDDMYYWFNVGERPAEYKGHSASVSDIFAIKCDNKISFYFIDSMGFKELPEEAVVL